MIKTIKHEERQIVHNAVQCVLCNDIIESVHQHDMKHCKCGKVSLDGGHSMVKIGADNEHSYKLLTKFSDQPYEEVRDYAVRGVATRDEKGKSQLTWRKIKDLSDEHLANILMYGGAKWHLELITKELQYRHKHGISIKEP